MEYPKHFKHFCLLILVAFVIYLSVTDHYHIIINSIKTSLTILPAPFQDVLIESNETNDTLIEWSPTYKSFESRTFQYHPHLALHILTQNLSLVDKRRKLILLGNGFFGDRDWGVAQTDRTPAQKMNSLFCPHLADYCDITTDLSNFSKADAVVYHIRDSIDKTYALANRHPKQRFVFALWESPSHTPNLKSYENFFNWTMTFRFDSHIITSYYSGNGYIHTSSDYYRLMLHENITRQLNLKTKTMDHRPSDEILQKKKLGTAAALISNCGGSSKRLEFIKELKRYVDVTIYGRCGEACPSKTNCRQFIADNYYFILSFENSLCLHYTTEKFFAALEYPVVPVVLGYTNYSYFIPSSGYIDTSHFSTMSSLAKFLNETRLNKEKYLSYFAWKKDYVWGIQDFFTPFCDLCLRLHLDSQPNVIKDIHTWWFDKTCQAAKLLP